MLSHYLRYGIPAIIKHDTPYYGFNNAVYLILFFYLVEGKQKKWKRDKHKVMVSTITAIKNIFACYEKKLIES